MYIHIYIYIYTHTYILSGGMRAPALLAAYLAALSLLGSRDENSHIAFIIYS